MSLRPSRQHHRIAVWLLCLLVVGAVLLAGSVGGQTATGTIEGTVENEIGEPIAGVEVTVNGDFGLTRSDTTDSDGTYTIPNIEYDSNEEYNITVEDGSNTYENVTRDDISFSTANPPVTEDFTAAEGTALTRKTGVINGTVSASSSSGPISGPIQGAKVTITHNSDQDLVEDSRTDLTATDTTDGSGKYKIEVPTGDIDITVEQDGYHLNNSVSVVGLGAGEKQTEDIELNAELKEVRGNVTNTEGEDILNATVKIANDDGKWPNLPPIENSTEADGSYVLSYVPATGIPNNDLSVTERKITADATTFQQNTKSEPIDGSDIDFELEHTDNGQLSGVVEDSNGNRLEGIEVRVEGVASAVTETNGNGEYTITNIPFGTHDVIATHPEGDYADTEQTDIEITDTETVDFVNDEAMNRVTPVDLSIDKVTPGLAQSGDVVTITYTFDEAVTDEVEYSITGRDTELVNQTLTTNGQATRTYSVPDSIEDGSYTVRFEALGTTVTESFTISNAINPEAVGELAPPVYTPAGDFVDISTGGEYMLIGGSTEGDESNQQQYLDVLRVNGGSTTLNTRLIGTNVSSEQAYGTGVTSYAHSIGADSEPQGEFADVSFEDKNGNEIASTLAEFRSEVGISSRSAPLQADRYGLVAGANGRIIIREDGETGFRRPVGRSNFVLTQNQELGEITTYVAPPGDVEPGGVPSDAVESDFVAKGERVYITVPAVGMWGALLEDGPNEELTAERIETLLQREEGVHMDLSISRYGSPNSRDATLQFEEGNDLEVSVDDTVGDWESDTLGDPPNFGGFTIGIDTRGSEPFTNQPQDGDVLTFEIEYQSPEGERFRYQDYSISDGEQPPPFDPGVEPDDGVEHFPYFGPSDTTISSNASFEYQDLSIRYDRTRPNGDLIVAAQSDAVILGSTTMAPGSPATIEIIANEQNPEPITINDVTVDDDRRFSTTADFSSLEPGDEAEIEFYAQNRQLDNRIVDQRTVRVVDDIENPARFEIESLPQNVTLQQRESLAEIETTITNTGSIVGQQLINFTIDGEPVREETIILEDGQSETLGLSGQFVTLPVGTYEYTVRTDNDEQTGQLTVTPPDSGTTITSADSDTATSGSPLGENELPSDDTSDEGGFFGLLGIRSRDVAVATAVTGAVHVLGYWT